MSREPWRRARALAIMVGLIVSAFALTMTTDKVSNDVETASLAAWRIAQTGTPWLEDVDWQQYERTVPLWITEAANGHEVANRAPGPIAAGVPGYLVSRLVGVQQYSPAPASAMAVLITTAALALLFGAVEARAGTRTAVVSVSALALTTPVWSVAADSLWAHSVTVLGIGGMAYGCARERWWLVGVCGGVSLWGRLHLVVIVALLGLGLSLTRRSPRIALVVGSVSAAWLGLACAWARWMYGTWSPAGGYSVDFYAERAVTSTSPVTQLVNHLGMWIAPDRGILVWTPALLLLVPALVRSWPDLPDWSKLLVGGGLAYTLIQGQLNGFTGGSGFYGYRLTLELLVCAFPAIVFSLRQLGSVARLLLGPTLGLQFAAISLGATIDVGLFETEAWSNNSFVYALTQYPLLVLWPCLLMVAGLFASRVLSTYGSGSAPPSATRREEPREPTRA